MRGRNAAIGTERGFKSALSMLRELARHDFSRRNPNWRTEQYPLFKYTDKTANGLTKCIVHYLRFIGHQAERISCTGRPVDQRVTFTDVLGHQRQIGSVKWIRGSMQRGTADISATICGKSVKVEVKVGRDRQSSAQAKYQQQVEAAGGLYFVASSFQGFCDWYSATFKQ